MRQMIKNFIRFAIDRPILNHIFFILLLMMAFFAYHNIPKEIFPPSELDKVRINGGYPGASADVLDNMVVKAIENDLQSVSKIDNIDSVIQNGMFSITADIKSGADNQVVLGDIKDVIASVKRDLPADMSEPTAKMLIADFPLLLIAISGDEDKAKLLVAAEALKSKLSGYKDLNHIDIYGNADDEVMIEIDERRLDGYGISRAEFYQAIRNLSSIYPAGTIKSKGKVIYLSTINGEKSAKALENTLLSIGHTRIPLGDIAKVTYGLSTPANISHFNGRQNVSINTTKTKEGNAIKLSKDIRIMLAEFKKQYPDLIFEIYTDTSIWIKNRINLVSSNIFFGLILVFLAIFISVSSRIAMVVAIGIPTSFFIALVAMNMLDYSMNMLTMLGALIALGMLVDEAIVVAENIYRHLEMGKDPREAAIDGAVEMFPAILTATMTTVFAFLPLLIMSGEMGMFMKVLPVMISVLLVSSLFEAFYFLPLHAKEFFSMGKRITHHEKSRFWDWFTDFYGSILGWLLRFKKISLVLIIVLIAAGTVGMLKIMKFQLMPTFDATQIYISGKVDVNNKLKDTEKHLALIEQAILKDINQTNIASITAITGLKFNPDQSFEIGDHLFQVFVNLHEKKPKNLFDKYINPYLSLEYDDHDMIRGPNSQTIADDIKKNIIEPMSRYKDSKNDPLFKELFAYVPQTGIVASDIEIGFSGQNDSILFAAIAQIEQALKDINGTSDIANNAKDGPQELKFRINEYGQSLGFNESTVISSLRGLFLEAEYGKMFSDSGLIRIKVRNPSKDDNYDLRALHISTPDKQRTVQLRDIADFTYKTSMLKVYKEGGAKVWTITARTDKKVILPGEVMQQIEPLLSKLQQKNITIKIKGEEKENQQVIKEMSQAAVIAIFLIFISLVWMFNSLALPLITISTIPLSILGALIGTHLLGVNLTMPGIMGMVGLAGVVVNDGLIMLSFVKGSKTHDKLISQAKMRLRPIFLTSITTVLGLSTLMFFASGQSLIIQPMALALGFGVAWSTVLNLIYTPLMYAVVYRVKENDNKLYKGKNFKTI